MRVRIKFPPVQQVVKSCLGSPPAYHFNFSVRYTIYDTFATLASRTSSLAPRTISTMKVSNVDQLQAINQARGTLHRPRIDSANGRYMGVGGSAPGVTAPPHACSRAAVVEERASPGEEGENSSYGERTCASSPSPPSEPKPSSIIPRLSRASFDPPSAAISSPSPPPSPAVAASASQGEGSRPKRGASPRSALGAPHSAAPPAPYGPARPRSPCTGGSCAYAP